MMEPEKEKGAGGPGIIVLSAFVDACAMPTCPSILPTPDPFSFPDFQSIRGKQAGRG
jgi:hypothetical protein